MDPPEFLSIKQFMTNNNELPEAVMQDVLRGLAGPRQDLANLNAEIKELRERVDQLMVKREQIEKHLARFRCVLSPIRRVPVDILHNIFYHCLPTRRDPTINARESPLLLTRICRTWRQTALASPRLWSRIYITFSDEDTLDDAHISYGLTKRYISDILRLRCSAVEEWLSRSGACPLSISLCYTSRVYVSNSEQSPGNSDHTLTLFRVLSRFSSRWQRLELRMPIEVYRILENLVPNPQLPILDSLRTSFYSQLDSGFDIPEEEPAIRFLQAPKLTRISLSSYPTTYDALLSNPTLTRLTTLSLNWMLPVSQIIFLLKKCPNLKYAMVTIMSDFQALPITPHTNPGVISLPHLRALSIVDATHSPSANHIYEIMDTPGLEWFHYAKEIGYIDRTSPYPDQSAVSSLLRRSANIKKLMIEANTITTGELRTILRNAQSVTHLVFGPEMSRRANLMAASVMPVTNSPLWNFGDLFLEDGDEVMGSDSGLTLLPRLEILEVSEGPSMHVTDAILQDVIVSRLGLIASQGVSPLRKVAVIFIRSRKIDISKALSAYYSQSSRKLELSLDYLNHPDTEHSWHFVSSGYGMDQYDRSWQYTDIEEEVPVNTPF